jgi:hypothetical protein
MNAMQIQVAADAAGTLDQARPRVFDLVAESVVPSTAASRRCSS